MYICAMERKENKSEPVESMDFVKEYNQIIDPTDKNVIVKSEWTKEGDYFQKLSMYDNSYTPIPTLGETTLINTI
jgi:hypothetical protein